MRNENGEHHAYEHDPDGLVVSEVGFDGSRRTFRHDARGRVVSVGALDRGTTELTRDLLGRIVAETTSDGSTWTYDYDAAGRLIRSSGPDVSVIWHRDAAGDVVRETTAFDGTTYAVDSILDPEGRRLGYRTSLAHEADFRRDARGEVEEIWANGEPCAAFLRSESGLSTRTSLNGGGVLREHWDDADRLVERRVERAGGPARAQASAPEWVGGDGDLSSMWRFGYDALSEIRTVESSRDGVVAYTYGARRRLRSATKDGLPSEAFFVDSAGSTVPQRDGAPPEIAPGNRLVWSDRFAYTFDAGGFLRERRDTRDNALTRYHWNGHRLLRRVDLADGRAVTFAYDAAARRTRKTVVRPAPDGDDVPERTVHYVWDGPAVRHEVSFDAAENRAVRTYVAEDSNVVTPLGHYDDDRVMRYYVTRPTGMPEQLVDGAGHLVGSLSYDAYGQLVAREGAQTNVRAAGQLEDAETGLFYNRYRYYDPAIGR